MNRQKQGHISTKPRHFSNKKTDNLQLKPLFKLTKYPQNPEITHTDHSSPLLVVRWRIFVTGRWQASAVAIEGLSPSGNPPEREAPSKLYQYWVQRVCRLQNFTLARLCHRQFFDRVRIAARSGNTEVRSTTNHQIPGSLHLRQFATSLHRQIVAIVEVSGRYVFKRRCKHVESGSHFATGAVAPVFFIKKRRIH